MRGYPAVQVGLRHAIEQGDLAAVRSFARELGRPITLDQAADVLAVIQAREPQTFDRAAARWIARLVFEEARKPKPGVIQAD